MPDGRRLTTVALGTPCVTHPHGYALPRALVAAGATANRVQLGTAPDLAAVAALLAGDAEGRVVSCGIALAVGLSRVEK